MLLLAASLAMATPTAVMIHGAGGGGWEYRAWIKPFEAKGFRVVAKDLVPKDGDYARTTFDDYVRQVRGWCPKQGPVILVGASMGGILALKAAETVRPAAIVLVNAVTPEGSGAKTYPDIVRWANGPLKDTVDSMPDSDEATIQFAWKRWRDESGAVLTTISKGISVRNPKCPVLAVIGENDTDVPVEHQLRAVNRFKADQIRYAGMSHVGPLLSTRGAEVAATVADWCQARIRGKIE